MRKYFYVNNEWWSCTSNFNWWAIDANGHVYLFENKPVKRSNYWSGGFHSHDIRVVLTKGLESITIVPMYWTTTLKKL